MELEAIRDHIRHELSQTPFAELVAHTQANLFGGKMLRVRLMLHTGHASRMDTAQLHGLAAAVEMLQMASLLHDDLLDRSTVRRSAPSFWVAEGATSAILFGDFLLGSAVGLVHTHLPQAVPALSHTITDMCSAEAQQAHYQTTPALHPAELSMRIARRKTGSLFGFAARCTAGSTPDLADTLQAAGSDLGTAYQIADDILDQRTDIPDAGKMLGTDARDNRITTASLLQHPGTDPYACIEELLQQSRQRIAHWPTMRQAWDAYIDTYLRPTIQHMAGPPPVAAAPLCP